MNVRRAILLCGALSGCSYPGFEFSPQDGGADATVAGDTAEPTDGALADIGGDVPPTDAGVDARDATTTGDVDASDASVALDGGDTGDAADARDASDARDAADTSSPGCVGDASVFCIDFDDWSSSTSGFTGTHITAGGTTALDTVGISPPNAFESTVLAAGDGGVVAANGYRTITVPTAATTMRIDAWIQLDSAAFPSGQAFLFKVQHDIGDGVALAIDRDGFYVEVVGEPYAEYRVPTPVPVGRWFHARMDVKMLITGGSTTVWIDDMGAGAFSKAAISTARTDDVARRVAFGLYASESSTTFRARFDDVSLRFVP